MARGVFRSSTGAGFAGPAELGGRVGTASVPGYAAPGTHLNDPEKWEGKSRHKDDGRHIQGSKRCVSGAYTILMCEIDLALQWSQSMGESPCQVKCC